MKILLRNLQTKLFVGEGPQLWVHREQAKDSQHISWCAQAAAQYPFGAGLELFVAFDDPTMDFCLQLSPTPKPQPPRDTTGLDAPWFTPQ